MSQSVALQFPGKKTIIYHQEMAVTTISHRENHVAL